MFEIKLGNKAIGDDQECYIVFEIGPTHTGFDSAKRLIKHAFDAGGNAVKFQIFNVDKLVADKSLMFTYKSLLDKKTDRMIEVTEPLYDILSRRCLTATEWRSLKAYADSLGMTFFSTVSFEEDVDFLVDIGCDSIKISSADIDHYPLIQYAAKTGMLIQLDTGMATIGEIEKAIRIIESENNNRILIHVCPSGYPARLESINLKMLSSLKNMFNYPVAFSDHTPGNEMDIAAVSLGANLVEKTITENRLTRSAEHVMSLEPNQMSHFVKTIRDVEIAIGHGRREITDKEQQVRKDVRRSAHLKKNVNRNDIFTLEVVEFRRPGYGLSPEDCLNYIDQGFVCNKDKCKDSYIEVKDLCAHE